MKKGKVRHKKVKERKKERKKPLGEERKKE